MALTALVLAITAGAVLTAFFVKKSVRWRFRGLLFIILSALYFLVIFTVMDYFKGVFL